MAGLQQYYFFPTDFFYPRAPSPAAAASDTAVLPVQAFKDVDSPNPIAVASSADSSPQAISTAAPTRLSLSPSAIKRELRRVTPIIADSKKFSDA